MNSLDGSWAVRAKGTGVRIACANQPYAGMNTLVELREVHLSSATDLLSTLQNAIHAILARFRDALRVYETAVDEEMLAEDVGPAPLAAGLPRVHASAIGARAERYARHNALLTRSTVYHQVTTRVLRHGGAPRGRAAWARAFGRVVAGALLLCEHGAAPA